MRVTVPGNLLPLLIPGFPLWATLTASAVAAGVGGFCLSSLAHQVLVRDLPQTGGRGRPGRVRFLSVLSGPNASVIGSLIGFVLGGAYGQFVGNPLGALGVGVANPAALRRLGVAASNEWTSTFLAGWIGSWVGQITAQFAFPYLPHGAHLMLSAYGTTLQIPVPELFGYVVGTGVAVITRLGRARVAIGSTIATARAGIAAGLLWLAAVAVAALALLPTDTILKIAGTPFGVRGSTAVHGVGPVVTIVVAALLSLLLASLAIPRIIAHQWNDKVRFSYDREGKISSIDVYSRSPIQYLGPGAFAGALFTVVVAFAAAEGLGEWFRSWATLVETVAFGAVAGAILSAAVGWSGGRELTGPALREMEQQALRGESINPMTYADPYLLALGELTFGTMVGLALAGLTYYGLEWRFSGVPITLLLAGIAGGVVLAILLVVTFHRVMGTQLEEVVVHEGSAAYPLREMSKPPPKPSP
jgi:hypothetical protein